MPSDPSMSVTQSIARWLDALFNIPYNVEEIVARGEALTQELQQFRQTVTIERAQIRDAIDRQTAVIAGLTADQVTDAHLAEIRALNNEVRGYIPDTPAPTPTDGGGTPTDGGGTTPTDGGATPPDGGATPTPTDGGATPTPQ